VNREHETADDPEGLAAARPPSRAGDNAKPGDATAAGSDPGAEGAAVRDGSQRHTADVTREPRAQAADGPGAQSRSANGGRHSRKRGSQARRRWKQWGGKAWAGVGLVLTAGLGAWLGIWLGFFYGPPAPAASALAPIGDPGHAPGRQDVSTLSPGHRFYAVANFYYDQGCGRPCWQPLVQLPNLNAAGLTKGWPCEYYDPASASSGPYCVKPPPGRAPGEMADSRNQNAGDRILVVCQAMPLGNTQGQLVHNQAGQASDIWDMIALPSSRLIPNDVLAGRLSQVPGMPGFYEAYAPDIWLGNTGWHGIPCK
jgi:hypothetical protein